MAINANLSERFQFLQSPRPRWKAGIACSNPARGINKNLQNFSTGPNWAVAKKRRDCNIIYFLPQPPFTYFWESAGLDPSHVPGYSMLLWDLLEKKLNFT